MDPFAVIQEQRDAWESHVGLIAGAFATPKDVAAKFGLRREERAYRECDRDRAAVILQSLLQFDLAYGAECMSESETQSVIEALMELFPIETQFYTNGIWANTSSTGKEVFNGGWTPATDCTFDAGIIALGKDFGACVWFGDED